MSMGMIDGRPESPLNPKAPVEVQYAVQEIARGTRALRAAVDRFPSQNMSDLGRKRMAALLESQTAVLRGLTEVAETWNAGS